MRWKNSLPLALVIAWGAGLAGSGCAVNPATGRSQLMLISEAQERAMGQEADPQIVAAYGLYPDPEIQDYVQSLGMDLAAESERPDIPWEFKVLDDPLVNAFAVPGGYIYITRGILTHLNTEAELAAVLGHEIGHVVARHSANQMSKQQLTVIGLGVGAILLDDDDWPVALLAGVGAQLMFLKFSRDDERQSDDLGLRYIDRAGYDPRPMTEVFETLGRVSAAAGSRGTPNWAATHPAPENRVARLGVAINGLGVDFSSRRIGADVYLGHLDGMVFGANPREGFFVGSTFYHPDLALQLDFPEGWTTRNEKASVVARSPGNDAMMTLSLSQADSLEEAENGFYNDAGVTRGGRWRPSPRGLSAIGSEFEGSSQGQSVRGRVAFIDYDSRIFQLLSYSQGVRWSKVQPLVEATAGSFSKLEEREYLDVQPQRVEVVTLDRAMSLEEFDKRYPSTVDLDTLAIVNHARAETRFEAGARVKRLVGGQPKG